MTQKDSENTGFTVTSAGHRYSEYKDLANAVTSQLNPLLSNGSGLFYPTVPLNCVITASFCINYETLTGQ